MRYRYKLLGEPGTDYQEIQIHTIRRNRYKLLGDRGTNYWKRYRCKQLGETITSHSEIQAQNIRRYRFKLFGYTSTNYQEIQIEPIRIYSYKLSGDTVTKRYIEVQTIRSYRYNQVREKYKILEDTGINYQKIQEQNVMLYKYKLLGYTEIPIQLISNN